jgi:putative ATP-dependent endonuclease of OLD family
VSIPVRALGIEPATLKKIQRYLDVTRSAVLFGTRVMLVEGIAEAILLPVIAKHIVLRTDREALQRFRGGLVLPIDGVDFKPYVEILLTSWNGHSIADRVVVVTDADPYLAGNRKEDLQALAGASSAKLSVFTNTVTLEHELCQAGNQDILRNAFVSLHPRSLNDWVTDVVNSTAPADGILKLFDRKKVRKGDFAQRLAELIEKGHAFNVPQYLQAAISKLAEE